MSGRVPARGIEPGDGGPAVVEVTRMLVALGRLPAISPVWGPGQQTAFSAWHRASGGRGNRHVSPFTAGQLESVATRAGYVFGSGRLADGSVPPIYHAADVWRVIEPGDRGAHVAEFQRMLIALGYDLRESAIYDAATIESFKHWQRSALNSSMPSTAISRDAAYLVTLRAKSRAAGYVPMSPEALAVAHRSGGLPVPLLLGLGLLGFFLLRR